jgi:hypothetical protein
VGEEGTKHGGFGRARGRLVVERHHHHRQPQHVGEQDELLALVVAHFAGGGQELDALEPLFLGQVDLARERVQVLHQALHQLLEAGILDVLQARDHRFGQCVLVELAHRAGLSFAGKCITAAGQGR